MYKCFNYRVAQTPATPLCAYLNPVYPKVVHKVNTYNFTNQNTIDFAQLHNYDISK